MRSIKGVKMKSIQKIITWIIFGLFVSVFPAMAIQEIYTPDILKPWKNWVLHNNKQFYCPFEYNNDNNRHCDWTSHLELDLKSKKSHFTLKGILFKAQFVLLPGQNGCWPDGIFYKNTALAVIPYKNHPAVFLPEGQFEITGSFLYDHLPESIYIPPQLGLLTLLIDGKTIPDPFISKDHRLWLRTGHTKGPSGNRMHVRMYRLITDSIPMIMTHHLQLSVSGSSREELLNHVLPDQSIVMSIESPVPVQLDENNNLRLHVRTGKFSIVIVSRFINPVHHMTPNFLLQDNEIWSFKLQPHLRMVQLLGLQGMDPASSGVPKEWQKYPAYRVFSNSDLTFQEQQRGDPDPSPDQLKLNRDLWLDFDGKGYTIHDQIKGTINQNWRLNMHPSIQLGRVSFSKKDQLLTQYNNQSGVEIRTGHLDLTSDARYTESIRRLPVIGWDHSMNHVRANLNLPPGWRLLSVFGADTVSGSWLGQWRLLDLFLALLIGMAIYHLINIQWAALGWITMILTFHEHAAPHLTWLHLLVVIALLNVVSQGWIHKLMRLWFVFAVVLICMFILPFMMYQIQSGLYPQLERHTRARHISKVQSSKPMTKKSYQLDRNKIYEISESVIAQGNRKIGSDNTKQGASNAVIQTGPGLPEWKWKSVRLEWNGPVDKRQYLKLWLLPPSLNCVLAIFRVFLVSLLLYGMGRRFSHLCISSSSA
jgi:hypothetical protein